MAENLISPPKKDNTPVWFELPNGSKRVFPRHAVAKMLADKNRGWKECEPEFTPANKIRPYDEGKTHTGIKNANTEKTGRQIEEFLMQTVNELKDYAAKNGVSLTGCKTKKEILEAIEKAGKLL
jgi:phosphoribosylaminoimidazole-succinocarboxamide synthase